MATQSSANMTPREVPTYVVYEFHPRQSRYAVLIPVIRKATACSINCGVWSSYGAKGIS